MGQSAEMEKKLHGLAWSLFLGVSLLCDQLNVDTRQLCRACGFMVVYKACVGVWCKNEAICAQGGRV